MLGKILSSLEKLQLKQGIKSGYQNNVIKMPGDVYKIIN